jgi:hypothetical protein
VPRLPIREYLLPDHEHAGFGSLLYDENGELVLHEGNKIWLYTTGLFARPTGGQRDCIAPLGPRFFADLGNRLV